MSPDFRTELARLQESGRLRQLRPLSGRQGCRVVYQGQELLNLTSNDYLGLAGDEALLRRFYTAMDSGDLLEEYGLGAASSRLLAGDSPSAHALEKELAQAYGRPAALLYNSGYHANIGILPALLGKKDLILSDKLNHASIHDGMGLCRATHRRYAHADYDHLRALLDRYRHRYERVVIVSESVFSMDGDVADLAALVRLKNEFDALLYLDEAHAVGLYGEKGLGKAEEAGLVAEMDLLVGTFGKALASVGAFVVCSEEIRDYLVNRSRSLIFTTALPPVNIHWSRFIFGEQQAMGERRQHLARLSRRLRQAMQTHRLPVAGTTNIIPVIIGADGETVRLAARLQNQGFLLFPVRPPAVPEGTARFRLSLTAGMEWEDLQHLPEILERELDAAGSSEDKPA